MYIQTYFIKCWTLLEDFSLLYFQNVHINKHQVEYERKCYL